MEIRFDMKLKNPVMVYSGLSRDIYFLFISRIVSCVGNFVMPLITLILTEKIGFSKSTAGTLSTIAMLSQAPFLMLGGRLADRFGSKKVIFVFNLIGSILYLPCAFIKPSLLMAVFIVLAANTYSISSPAYNAIIAENTSGEGIKKAYSLLYLGFNLGQAIGPALGGIFFHRCLPLVFILDSATTIASIVLIQLFVKDNRKNVVQEPSCEGPERKTEKLSLSRYIFHYPAILIFAFIMLLYNFAYVQWSFLLPLQVSDLLKGNGAWFYSLLVSTNAITVILFTPLITSFTHNVKPLTSISAGAVFYMVAFIIFGVNKDPYPFVVAIVIMTIGEILVMTNSNTFVAQVTPPECLGRVNSLITIVNGAGYAIGPIIMGNAVGTLHYPVAWLIISAVMLLVCVLMFTVSRGQANGRANINGG